MKVETTRINVTFSNEVVHLLQYLSTEYNQSLATLIRSLVSEAIDNRENEQLLNLVDILDSSDDSTTVFTINPTTTLTNAAQKYCIYCRTLFLETDMPALDAETRSLVINIIGQHLIHNPESIGKAIPHNNKHYRRVKIKKYRLIYRIEKEMQSVTIVGIVPQIDLLKVYNNQ